MALYEGWRWREERRKEELALVLHYTVNPHLKDAIPYDEFLANLIGRERFVERKLQERDERRRADAADAPPALP